MAKVLLNVQLDEIPALLAALDIAQKAASGYSVRTCPARDVISSHWDQFNSLHNRVKELENSREFGMGKIAEGHAYVHIAIDAAVHDRFYEFAKKRGGGKIQKGSLGDILEKALVQYINSQEGFDNLVKSQEDFVPLSQLLGAA